MRGVLTFVLVFFVYVPVFGGSYLLDLSSSGRRIQRRWEHPHIKWRYNPDGAPAHAEEMITRAFSHWTSTTHSQIQVDYAGVTSNSSPSSDGYSDFIFNRNLKDLGMGFSDDTIAVTLINAEGPALLKESDSGFISEADIFINSRFRSSWVDTLPTDATELDLEEVLTHEIGHALGLGHSNLVDSVMFAAKPVASQSSEFINLFPVPKRLPSDDDRAFLSGLYPDAVFKKETGEIAGLVLYNGRPFIGAVVTAVNLDAEDSQITYYPSVEPTDLVVRGRKNIAAFSEAGGSFKIEGLSPGHYRLIASSGAHFLGFGLNNISTFLSNFGSSEDFPLQIWQGGECSNSSSLQLTTFEENFREATNFPVLAGKALCNANIQAHPSQSSVCRSTMVTRDLTCSTQAGGCSLDADSVLNVEAHPGLPLIFLGGVLILIFARLKAKRERAKREELKRLKERDWL